jgi:hypothetical protein
MKRGARSRDHRRAADGRPTPALGRRRGNIGAEVKSGLQVKVQIAVKSAQGEAAGIQEVARLERGPLRPDALGLSRAEARAILAGLEQVMPEQQPAERLAQAQRCARCAQPRSCKGPPRIVVRTPLVN